MKNVLLKFAGLFVEKVPIDQQGQRVPPPPNAAPGAQPGGFPRNSAQPGSFSPSTPLPGPIATHGAVPGAPPEQGAGPPAQLLSVALRAWVPQEYAAHLAPHGLHVIAAGGSVTSEQARTWGANVLIISAECLGQDVHLLQQPALPTVFITPQPVMLPDVSGVVQAQEPLRASDVAHAAREAVAGFAARAR